MYEGLICPNLFGPREVLPHKLESYEQERHPSQAVELRQRSSTFKNELLQITGVVKESQGISHPVGMTFSHRGSGVSQSIPGLGKVAAST